MWGQQLSDPDPRHELWSAYVGASEQDRFLDATARCLQLNGDAAQVGTVHRCEGFWAWVQTMCKTQSWMCRRRCLDCRLPIESSSGDFE